MTGIQLNGVTKRYGDTEVIAGLDLHIHEGEFLVFLGPSGCGKSTLLRMIAGLEGVSEGQISIGGREVTDLPPARRDVAMVFQHYALYPHMTVYDNMAFGLRNTGVAASEIERRITEAARMLELDALLKRRPAQLSGGQRQRVAIGRAVVKEPEAFLFDEPLSNLDASLRTRTRVELARIHRRLSSTMIFVTHDQIEAMTLATRIVVMNRGRIEQIGAPLEIYRHPATRFVAGFIGAPAMNFIDVEPAGENGGRLLIRLPVDNVVIPTTIAAGSLPPGQLTLGVRAEHVVIDPDGALTGRAEFIERLGDRSLAHVSLASNQLVVIEIPREYELQAGDLIRMSIDAAHLHLFDASGMAHHGG
ncbi:sn-glycerol-3-phosphate ABC transporter ATP-binding protein UgpC (plasmid) [Paraburkholderia sprentiae WSM5005]|uniref:Sn-glycerol-3-phosphate ABC transporter ATP-binding protein UgpC n=1 Tax=Paraburkholderia sprentiae WSM5005 TaxID=754502 RepID=A0A1I9YUI0_9BURK|nr:sn-glycerol-3-phosphate ABC transporter ATP-binding protein UgpC [Paraburkholderia sprentiae]APA89866.1 sn-glycerol-3-phosphate ABC transporter ATP-binding protein UgpC [Paraburkholderia sprentiae WSM5005]